MLDLHSRKNWFVLTLLPLGVACASTTLPIPADAAANPNADTMPLSSETRALQADYDPWATQPAAAPAGGSGHEGHQHERGIVAHTPC